MKLSDNTWSMLQELREACVDGVAHDSVLALREDTFEFADNGSEVGTKRADAVFSSHKVSLQGWAEVTIADGRLYMYAAPGADPELLQAFRLYVPLCCATYFYPDQSFVIAHMAQSLDGRVATAAGNSKWIGNDANLTHAHRIRALVDGVIVGGVTAQHDLPSLSVRNVSGRNPARIILSDSFDDVEDLPNVAGMRTILVRAGANETGESIHTGHTVLRYAGDRGNADITELLASLRRIGISTLLIEGGPTTVQSFLSAAAVDWLQLHIAPILFGSGHTVLSLPPIDQVSDAMQLKNTFYVSMGDGMMITGQV